MGRFDRLSNYNMSERTAWIEVPELGKPGKPARLEVMHAGEPNKPFYNAMLRMAGKRARKLAQTKDIRVEDIEHVRKDDVLLYSKFVVVGWEFVLEDDLETEVPFSMEACVELFRQIIAAGAPQIFDRIRDYAQTEAEFLSEDEILPDIEVMAGNLQTGSSGS